MAKRGKRGKSTLNRSDLWCLTLTCGGLVSTPAQLSAHQREQLCCIEADCCVCASQDLLLDGALCIEAIDRDRSALPQSDARGPMPDQPHVLHRLRKTPGIRAGEQDAIDGLLAISRFQTTHQNEILGARSPS